MDDVRPTTFSGPDFVEIFKVPGINYDITALCVYYKYIYHRWIPRSISVGYFYKGDLDYWLALSEDIRRHNTTTVSAMALTNRAAWLREVNSPLEVGPSEVGKPGPDEVLVKNRAVAMNPVDWMMQYGAFPAGPLPRILGNDVAGDVVEVGEGVTRFKKGQRVLAHAIGLATNEPKHGGFQEYTVVPTVGCTVIPDGMKYEEASVLPLAISTASIGLFHEARLGLRSPVDATEKGSPGNEAILVWGGSSSVGATAIQLAVAAQYTVIATASPRNFDLCKKLGASEVFDHSSPGIVGDLTAALQKYTCRGAFDAVAKRDTQLNVAQVLAQLGGGKMASVLPPVEELPATVQANGSNLRRVDPPARQGARESNIRRFPAAGARARSDPAGAAVGCCRPRRRTYPEGC
ncbi:Alcohol dehydrogenase GroES-like domain-containing protein isoform 3 [Cladophialophora immunda]|nr:Alcohol dehydrogenase GroES-like domain-containing protein isoform 3 [Cladophialophora immunda]